MLVYQRVIVINRKNASVRQFQPETHQELRQHLWFWRHSPDQSKRIEGSTGRAKADGGMMETAIDVGMIIWLWINTYTYHF